MFLQRCRSDLDDFFGLGEIFALVEEKFHGIKSELESKNERILKLERSLEEKMAEAEFLKLKVGNLKKENSEHLKNMKNFEKLNKELQENILIIGRKVTETTVFPGNKSEFGVVNESQNRQLREESIDVIEAEYDDSELETLMESTDSNEDIENVMNVELDREPDLDSAPEHAIKSNRKILANIYEHGLKVAERDSNADQEFSCQECPYKTQRNVKFKVHKLTHTGGKISINQSINLFPLLHNN